MLFQYIVRCVLGDFIMQFKYLLMKIEYYKKLVGGFEPPSIQRTELPNTSFVFRCSILRIP